ncbi:hypothetical protein CLOP_g6673 [Closterium sp. NIES-67]|nr:hypothetical protein CLOP_g17267 [Closterium sp. NIES-67]GJP76300.1 hypothetical protein CLOP_g6673 [Closterium sp. NIES-67]
MVTHRQQHPCHVAWVQNELPLDLPITKRGNRGLKKDAPRERPRVIAPARPCAHQLPSVTLCQESWTMERVDTKEQFKRPHNAKART